MERITKLTQNPTDSPRNDYVSGGLSNTWITEYHRNIYRSSFRVTKTLYSDKSDFQKVDVVETAGHGRMLLNDGLIMVTERDEAPYHEMMAHVPLFTHPDPKNVLVIGGGDGGTMREVLKHPGVEKCTLVEIDPKVIAACREFLPTMACSLDHEKAEVRIEDGVEYIKNTPETFDVLCVDSTDPFGPATPLFSKAFYQDVFNKLSPEGIVVSQGESPFYEIQAQKQLVANLREVFPFVSVYNFCNMTYPGGLWSFTYASKGLDPISDFQEDRARSHNFDLQYYNAAIHKGAFALPEFMRRELL